jgi:hypothetical protein
MNATMSCPRCGYPATPGAGPQTCQTCRGTFALYPGAASDPSVVPPPPHPALEIIKVRSAGAFQYRFGAVEPLGVAEGTLDPVIAVGEMDRNGIAWPDVASIAIWRKPDYVELGVAIFIPLPLALLFWFMVFAASAGFLILALPFTALGAFMVYRAMFRKKHFARIVGRYGMIEIRFDRPGWRRQRFHAELLRRAGLRDAPIP